VAHAYFARVTERFLTYHLGRELARHVGGNGRFLTTDDHSEFLRKLATHCNEAAAITREFAGGWYSKANYAGEITEKKTRNFVRHALTKLRKEIALRGALVWDSVAMKAAGTIVPRMDTLHPKWVRYDCKNTSIESMLSPAPSVSILEQCSRSFG
jgi:hypothetical protein